MDDEEAVVRSELAVTLPGVCLAGSCARNEGSMWLRVWESFLSPQEL